MNLRHALHLLAALCLALLAMAPASAQESSVETYLRDWQQTNGIPGVAVAVLDGSDVTTYLLGDDGNGEPVTEDTPFLIGSVSKTLTSTLVLQLADEGLLGLDDEARDHLPWLDHPATVAQLLNHTAGYTAADGLALSERYDEHLSITEPTGMHTTAVDGRVENLPAGHRHWWGRPIAYSPGAEPSGAPYGYLVSTLADLGGYARAHLDHALIPEQGRDLAWSDQTGSDGAQGYGLGWRIDTSDRVLRVHHTGATPGYFAHVMLMPEQDRAVVVLANTYSEAVAPSLAAAATDLDDLAQGRTAAPLSADRMLSLLPWLLLIPLALAALGLATLWFRRPRTRARGLALGAVSLIVAGALLAAPLAMGMTWHVARAWAPDAALALLVGIVSWTGLAVFLVVAGWRSGARQPS